MSAASSWFRCAPPSGSEMISSITPRRRFSSAVRQSASAAAWLLAGLASFQRMAEHPSGLMTEYHACSSMATLSATAIPSAPPDPPSPITILSIGVRKRLISRMLTAMASAWPRSSAPIPGYAPFVSTSVTIGRPYFSANFMFFSALRYPSGWAQPKLHIWRSLVSRPLRWATSMTFSPPILAKPVMIAASSEKCRSPWSWQKSEQIRRM